MPAERTQDLSGEAKAISILGSRNQSAVGWEGEKTAASSWFDLKQVTSLDLMDSCEENMTKRDTLPSDWHTPGSQCPSSLQRQEQVQILVQLWFVFHSGAACSCYSQG